VPGTVETSLAIRPITDDGMEPPGDMRIIVFPVYREIVVCRCETVEKSMVGRASFEEGVGLVVGLINPPLDRKGLLFGGGQGRR